MKKLLVVVLVLAVAIGVLGYWRGWFNFSREGVQVDAEKFKKDREAFSKTVAEKAKVVKYKFASLMKKSEGLTDDEKKELAVLEKKHERLEKQLKELEDVGQDRFEGLKQDLSNSLAEVDKKIEELTKKLEKEKG